MPPPSSPWAFEVFDEITQCVGSLDGQMPTAQHIKKHQIPHPPATVPKFPNASNRLFKYKLCRSRKPTFTGFFKGSQSSNKTANIGTKSCKHHAHTECSKNYKILSLATLTSILTQKGSNDRLGRPHFGSNSPLYGQNCGQMAGVCTGRGGGWAVLELTAT